MSEVLNFERILVHHRHLALLEAFLLIQYPLVWQSSESKHTSEVHRPSGLEIKHYAAGDAAVDRLAMRQWDASIWTELLKEAQTFGRMSRCWKSLPDNRCLPRFNLSSMN